MNVEKVLRSLTPQYDMIVTIEKTKDLETMKMEDLQGSLEARKLRLNQRETNKDFEHALIAHSRKESSDDMKRKWKQRKGKHQREVTPDRKEKKKFEERSESSKRGGGYSKFQNKKNFQDKRRIQCFNCEKYGYFASNCWFEKGKKKTVAEKANMVQDDLDSYHVMLMIITSEGVPAYDVWYLDSGCPNHMTGHKGWLTDFNSNKKTNVKLADSRSFMAEGMSKIIIQRKEDKTTLIKDVLVVPGMQCSLLSIDQMVEKGFSIIMEGCSLKLYDKKKRMVLKSTLTKNKIWKASLKASESHCLYSSILDEESWFCHKRYVHMNFRSL
ncbi:uncharacterized protein LOC127104863 [Lathyrus oleraceus]|uniref:uncharacterized protein LOC127104863 n=1 Tax=Pisum sativum TaxID=3888 RepID=UPI0021CEC305|nr:uncharacterized protein LOC127104863 [Pisum sativum]